MKSNIPNLLTVSRIVFVFLFVVLAHFDSQNQNSFAVSEETAWLCHLIAFILAVIGGLTDLFDGYLARKYHWESDFGRLIDPLADKLFIMAIFSMLVEYDYMPAWILITILAREFLVTGLRTLASAKGIVIAADKLGKVKTAMQMFALFICGCSWVFANKVKWIPDITVPCTPAHYAWMTILYLTAGVTLLSGILYFVKYKKLYIESMF